MKTTVKICFISDIHGYLPPVPDCDLLVLGGDFNDYRMSEPNKLLLERKNLYSVIKPWLECIKLRGIEVVAVAGNHDMLFEQDPYAPADMPWTYLCDTSTTKFGLNIYGTPWTMAPEVRGPDNWAFHAPYDEQDYLFSKIPLGTDILVCHGPPYAIGDFTNNSHEHVGSQMLLLHIYRVMPKVVMFGHIHEGYGTYEMDGITFINASFVSDPNVTGKCFPWNYPVVLELPCPTYTNKLSLSDET